MNVDVIKQKPNQTELCAVYTFREFIEQFKILVFVVQMFQLVLSLVILRCVYLSISPHEQDVTQGQLFYLFIFFKQILTDLNCFPSPRLVTLPKLKSQICPTIYA